jgi:choline-sulfatase
MWENKGEMPAHDETFFQLLQGAGYFTAHIGKSHYYEQSAGLDMRDREAYMHDRGLEYVHETTGPHATCQVTSYITDAWEKKGLWQKFKQDYLERAEAGGAMVRPSPLPVEDFLDSYIGRKAVEFVEAYQDQRPMCLFVGFGGPHEPWDAPREYATEYKAEETPEPIPIPENMESQPEWILSKKDFAVWPEQVLAKTPEIRANYYGKISLIDSWVGRILGAFADRGWVDDLLVIFWSDHGEMLGDHGRLYKSTFHESSVRVALILRWPGRIPENVESNALAEIIDVFPTLVEAAGCEPSQRCVGRSLWPVLRDPHAELRKWQLSEIDHDGRHIMIRSREYKYVIDEQARGFMLYDLHNDPEEQDNLASAEGASSMEKELREAVLGRLVEAHYTMR